MMYRSQRSSFAAFYYWLLPMLCSAGATFNYKKLLQGFATLLITKRRYKGFQQIEGLGEIKYSKYCDFAPCRG